MLIRFTRSNDMNFFWGTRIGVRYGITFVHEIQMASVGLGYLDAKSSMILSYYHDSKFIDYAMI